LVAREGPAPLGRRTDSFPLLTSLVQYGEFRAGYAKDSKDTRMVAYGIRYLIENYIAKQWTMQDIEEADRFYK
jgi:nicotinamide phosphoribosyltransferase